MMLGSKGFKKRYRKKYSKGFTLAEMLITVAIMLILCGFGFVAILIHQRGLKRMEMDETAQEIFIAAQNHLTAAQASGQWEQFLKATAKESASGNRGTKLSYTPSDYTADEVQETELHKGERHFTGADGTFYCFTENYGASSAGQADSAQESIEENAQSETQISSKVSMIEEILLPEGAIDETLRGNHFYVEYDANGTIYGVFYTDADHEITAEDVQSDNLRTDAKARRDYKDASGKRVIIGYYGGALGELENAGDLYVPSVAVRNAESLVLYVVDKNYNRPISEEEDKTGGKTFQTTLTLAFEGKTSGEKVEKRINVDPTTGDIKSVETRKRERVDSGKETWSEWTADTKFADAVLLSDSEKSFDVVVPDVLDGEETTSVKAKYYAIVLDSIVRENGHFAELFPELTAGEDVKISATLSSKNGGEPVSSTVRVNSLFNSVRKESDKTILGLSVSGKYAVTVSNARHLQNLSTTVSGVDLTKIRKSNGTKGNSVDVNTVEIVRDIYWDDDEEALQRQETAAEKVTSFISDITSATGMTSEYGYNAAGASGETAITEDTLQIHALSAGTSSGTESAAGNQKIAKGAAGTGTGNSSSEPAAIPIGTCYGIDNVNITAIDGNNHTLAAFRFAGEQQAALINSAAADLTIQNLTLADCTAVTTGTASQSTSESDQAAAILIANIYSGTLENVTVCWYSESSTNAGNKDGVTNTLSGSGLEAKSQTNSDSRVLAANGAASFLIGIVDADAAPEDSPNAVNANGLVLRNVKIESGDYEEGQEVDLAAEGETAAAFIGRVKSGKVTVNRREDNTAESDEAKKCSIKVNGDLTLTADKGNGASQTAGVFVGEQTGGESDWESVPVVAAVINIETSTDGQGAAGGLIGRVTGGNGVTLKDISLSTHTLGVTGSKAAGGAIGSAASGTIQLEQVTIVTDKATAAQAATAAELDYGEAGQNPASGDKAYGIRITAAKGCAGGLIGAASDTAALTVQDAAVSGSGTQDQVEAGSSAGGLIGEAKGASTSIANSMASLYVRSEGNGGNVNGTSSTDGAGGLIGSASGTVRIENSYSGGRTSGTADETSASGSGNTGSNTSGTGNGTSGSGAAETPSYKDTAEPNVQGRYNVYLASGSGAAGGLVGKHTEGTLTISSSYSTSSVAVSGASDAAAGGLVGEAANLTANDTYCTGRVYAAGVSNAANASSSSGTNGSGNNGTSSQTTPNYGYYAGKLGSISGSRNYYLKGMEGAPKGAVGTLGGNSAGINIAETTLAGADYYSENCPIKQGTAAQRIYYFDASCVNEGAHYANGSTCYPFKTVTTAYARNLYDPDTGAQIESAAQNDSQYAEIGDWEVPKKESVKGAYGLIYYEKVWNGTKNAADTTFYYHGYLFDEGASAKEATYTEIYSTDSKGNRVNFVTGSNQYVTESGYLLLFKEGMEQNLYVCLGYLNQGIDNAGFYGKKVTELPQYNGSGSLSNVSGLKDYTAYNVTLSASEITSNDINYLFWPTNNQTMGVVLNLRTSQWDASTSKAAFTYLPFFADALQSADKGTVKSVSKYEQNKNNVEQGQTPAGAVIRSAGQLNYFAEFENTATSNNGFLSGSTGCVVEQQLDITYDKSKVALTDVEKDANGNYQTPATIKMISAGAELRSAMRADAVGSGTQINGEGVNDNYYVLDGLRAPLAEKVSGKLDQMKVTNIKASHFIGNVVGSSAVVEKITINGAQFGEGTDYTGATDGGFTGTVKEGAQVENCYIINASIYGNGFVKDNGNNSGGTIKNCVIVNATIWKNGFVENNTGTIENCGIYADSSLYEAYTGSNYRKMDEGHGNYDLVSIGIAPGGTLNSDSTAGFVQENTAYNCRIAGCYVAGVVYGASGKTASGFIGTAGCNVTVENSYANVVIAADGNASGFAGEVKDGSTITKCHALGVIEKAQDASGFVRSLNNGKVTNSYEAFWNVKASKWYPFYQSISTTSGSAGNAEDCYYLSDCKLNGTRGSVKYDDEKVKDRTYDEMKALKPSDLGGQTAAAKGKTSTYDRYLISGGETYPFPMPSSDMVAYGDWNYEDVNQFTLLYYEKLTGDDTYYIHGYTTDGNGSYTEVKTEVTDSMKKEGVSEDDGLMHAAGKTVEDDGYVLILRKSSNVNAVFQGVNGGTSSESKSVDSLSGFLKTSALSTDVMKALEKAAGVSTSSTLYSFAAENYLSFKTGTDNNNQFAGWQTYAESAGGTGITLNYTKTNVSAKFSFLPIFADTVNKPNGSSQFVSVRRNGDYNYVIRSRRQLKLLSDWDGGMWNSDRGSSGVTLAKLSYKQNRNTVEVTLEGKFDKEDTRYSYLSTSIGFADSARSVIRQELDIDTKGSYINFASIDGTYVGRSYQNSSGTNEAVKLVGPTYDFADVVTATGKIANLTIDQADYQANPKSYNAAGTDSEPAHGERQEFVEYNYGTLSGITVQNSKLAGAGLVYQNGDFTGNSLVGKRNTKQDQSEVDTKQTVRPFWISYTIYADKKATEYSSSGSDAAKTGVVDDCHVINSEVQGAGVAWNNYAGTISNSSVEATGDGFTKVGDEDGIRGAGLVKNNVAKEITCKQYEYDCEYYYYFLGMFKVSVDADDSKKLPAKETGGNNITDGAKAIIENCTVKNIDWADGKGGVRGDGFVGKNAVESTVTGDDLEFKAEINNCRVINVTAIGYGFAGENSGGAVITNSQVYAEKSGSKYTGSYSQSSIGAAGNDTSAGFVGTNGVGSTIDSCSFTGQVQGKLIGGFAYINNGTIENSYANLDQVWNSNAVTVGGFVYSNTGTILYCHSLGMLEGSKTERSQSSTGKMAGFVWTNENGTIRNSYTAVWYVTQASTYGLFAGGTNGTFESCYAMKPGSGSWTSSISGVQYVSGSDLKTKTNDLGNVTGAQTVVYSHGGSYGFPVHMLITNYGDWYDEWDSSHTPSSSGSGRSASVTLDAGDGTFTESAIALSNVLSAGSEAADAESAISTASLEDAERIGEEQAVNGNGSNDTAVSSTSTLQLLLELETNAVNSVDGADAASEDSEQTQEQTIELDLSQLKPVREGWELVGWLITDQGTMETVPEKKTWTGVVTIEENPEWSVETGNSETDKSGTDASEDGSTEGQTGKDQADKSTAGKTERYILTEGTKSYHYGPDEVITITGDMTLAAVWRPSDESVQNAQEASAGGTTADSAAATEKPNADGTGTSVSGTESGKGDGDITSTTADESSVAANGSSAAAGSTESQTPEPEGQQDALPTEPVNGETETVESSNS